MIGLICRQKQVVCAIEMSLPVSPSMFIFEDRYVIADRPTLLSTNQKKPDARKMATLMRAMS